ncbi:siderophore ABC transporter substrate-binding protein [Mesobacillus maritimus]|uniref:siderophore ABC transporter substrate-binding protein n=1 Tax=Mesobacillus maritimus TaxID=1643336 RepID=UPI0020400446|nr:siderophore ABC transporter substrate-binding protein [Mesobacillus maritimus]MCM3586204.1 siderophore ABC transporter substrate-binding protein [Mesobacillus maritimus]MCM3667531.1 siderophore ABC transporter substrate-binding protein [Mesobacillus maritimus]
MKKKLQFLFLILFVAIFAAACGTESESDNSGSDKEAEAETITVTHELGETEVKKNPEKVVVFDYGVLDSLDKLGVEVTGLPKQSLPGYLEKYNDEKYENLGGLKEPDFEKINEVGPDLIIISGRQQDSYEELSEIAPTIYMAIDTTRYMESYEENAMLLGEIFGKEAEVEAELAKVKEDIQALNEKAKASGKNGLIILANEGNISAYGPGSRFGLLHDVFGVTPVDEKIEASTHGQNVSFEYLVEKDPDYLFIVDRGSVVEGGESSAKSIVENKLVENIKAVQNDQVVYLNADYWYLSGGGLTSVAAMVEEIQTALE